MTSPVTQPKPIEKANDIPHKEPQLANRTFLLLIVTGLLPSLVAALVMVQTQQALLTKRSRNLQQSADSLAKSFAQTLKTANAELLVLAENDTLTDRNSLPEAKRSWMVQAREKSDIFDELLVVDSQGQVIICTAQGPLSAVPRDWLERARRGQASVLGPVALADEGPEGLLLACPLAGRSGQVLLGFSSQKTFAADMESFVQGQSGVVMLASSDGKILAGSTPGLIGRHLQLARIFHEVLGGFL